jgi:hypothetical protein
VEVLELFGPPWREGQENGKIVWTYELKNWSRFNSVINGKVAQTKDKKLVILFNEKKRVDG